MAYRIQPSKKARETLQKDIETNEQLEKAAAIIQARRAEQNAHKQQIERAAELAKNLQKNRFITNDRRIYTTDWITWPERSGGDEKIQLELCRHDRVTKRILGIPYRLTTEVVELHLRLEDSAHKGVGEADYIARFEPRSDLGPRVRLGNPERYGKEDYWHTIESGSEEWHEIDRMLSVFEAAKPMV